ncbi:MAG: ABC transporter permease [Candidatus Acidiferrales bacterium]
MFGRKREASDFGAEIEAHIELEVERLREQGLSEEDARKAARRAFGNVTRAQESFYESGRWSWWDHVWQDNRYGARMLRKAPGFTAVAVLTIALGIGATTAIFSLVDATLLHPLPYPDPEQLVSVQQDLPDVGAVDAGISVPEWQDLARSGIFDYVSPIGGGDVNLTGWSQPARVRFYNIAPNYFALVGVKPQLGRSFNPEDHTPGFTLEVLLSDGLWKRDFAGDPGIVGKSLRLDNDLYRVIGVMPPGYQDPGRTADERHIELWAASGFAGPPAPVPQRDLRILPEVVARIKSGLTVAQAQVRVDALVAALQKQFPVEYPSPNSRKLRLVPLKETIVGNARQTLILLLGAVGLVLLIGCVNVANLQLARASARGREMAIRQALGAPRSRLIRQLLTESLLLAFLGGIAGLAILLIAKPFLLRMVPQSLPQLNAVAINWSVLLFALVSSLIAGAIFGLAPALHAGKVDLTTALKEGARGTSDSGEQGRTRRLLVVTEFALSLVLMIAAGLLLRSFADLLNVRPGFNPEKVMALRMWLPVPNDPATDIYWTVEQEAPFLREIVRRCLTVPGVQEIALSDMAAVPLAHARTDLNPYALVLEGSATPSNQQPLVNASIETPEYFHLLGIALLRGRFFGDSDDEKAAPVAVVNEAFARTYLPGGDGLGSHLMLNRVRGSTTKATWITVVGVVADARSESLADAGMPQVYLSLYQRRAKDLAILLRGQLDVAATPVAMREQVQAVNPELPVFGAQMLGDAMSASLSERRFSMEIVALFGVTALLLAMLGIYGVISYIVNARTREIGIRLALGANSRNILRMVLREGLTLAIAGAVVGLACALVVSHLMAGLLYGVRPTDPVTFAGVALLLIGVALLACYFPARRAIRVDPLTALRQD